LFGLLSCLVQKNASQKGYAMRCLFERGGVLLGDEVWQGCLGKFLEQGLLFCREKEGAPLPEYIRSTWMFIKFEMPCQLKSISNVEVGDSESVCRG
jgi:hypothetical protein